MGKQLVKFLSIEARCLEVDFQSNMIERDGGRSVWIRQQKLLHYNTLQEATNLAQS